MVHTRGQCAMVSVPGRVEMTPKRLAQSVSTVLSERGHARSDESVSSYPQHSHFRGGASVVEKHAHLLLLGLALAIVLVCNEKRIRLSDPDAEVRGRSAPLHVCAR